MESNNLEQSTKIKNTLFQKIKNFFKTEFYFFIKNYLYFIIFFSIIFYIIIEIINNTKNKLIITETKIFFYISIIFLFIMISDILEKPYDSVNKFIYIILFSIIILYICNYLIIKYYNQSSFIKKILLIIGISIIISILFILFVSFMGLRKIDVYNSFNYSINKNYYFLVFFMIYMLLYKFTFDSLNLNSTLTDILTPAVLGLLLIAFIFILIINLCLKLKIIKKINILNSFFSFIALLFFFGILSIYIFMNSLSTICKTDEPSENSSNEEIVIILMFISIFIILWLNDSRNWHRNGSIAFVFSSIIAFYTMFYYSIYHPNISMISLWLFIEWLMIYFKKKENSKNSVHFSFMTT